MEKNPTIKALNRQADDLAKKRELLMNMLADADSSFPYFVLGNVMIKEEKLLIKIADLAGIKKDYCDKAYGGIEQF